MIRTTIPRSYTWGIGLALVTALISGVSIYVNGFAVKQLPDPAVYTTLKNAVAAVLLVALAAAAVRPSAVKGVAPRDWGWLAVIGVIGGSIPFILFFTGLAQASAPSAAFIQKTLFIWVALLAVPLLGERLGGLQVAALGVLLAGQALILAPVGIRWGSGETMIAGATLLWALETILVRRVVARVPSPVVGAARLGFGLVVLVGFLALTGKLGIVAGLRPDQWGWALLTGGLLAGYVATWFAALQRAPASAVTAVLVLGAPVTAALQAISTGSLVLGPATLGQALVLIAVGAIAVLTVRGRVSVPATADAAA